MTGDPYSRPTVPCPPPPSEAEDLHYRVRDLERQVRQLSDLQNRVQELEFQVEQLREDLCEMGSELRAL